MYELRKQKNDVRAELLERRRNIEPGSWVLWDEKIAGVLLGSISYRFCDVMLAYASGSLEVSTDRIIDKALEHNKVVACPVSNAADSSMSFLEIKSRGELVPGAYNILEPPEANNKIDLANADGKTLAICLVPCLAYDSYGYRIGYGKGYYDRFLSNFGGTKIGLCYSDFKIERLPRGKYDIKLDVMITEKGVMVIK